MFKITCKKRFQGKSLDQKSPTASCKTGVRCGASGGGIASHRQIHRFPTAAPLSAAAGAAGGAGQKRDRSRAWDKTHRTLGL